MEEVEGAHRMSVRAGYVPGSNHGGNSNLGRGYENMESLTESRWKELEKEAVDAERKRKALEDKYQSSLQDQIRMQMKVIDMLCGKFVQPKRGGDITDDGYRSSEEWSGEKEGRVSSPLTPRITPRGGNQLILKPDHGKISSQEEEKNLRNCSKLITFNLEILWTQQREAGTRGWESSGQK